MQQRYQTPDGKIYEALPEGGYAEVIDTPQVSSAPYTIGTPDPKASLEVDRLREQMRRDQVNFEERNKPTLPAGYMMGPNGVAQPIPGIPDKDAPKPKTADELAGVRNEALDKIKLARSLIERSRDGWFATGFGSGIAGSIGGTEAYNVRADTETLKNAGALTRIMEMAQMNGGKNPLTPLSNSDFQALASSLSNLDTSQDDRQYQANVQRVIDLYQRAYESAGGQGLERELQQPAAPAIGQPQDRRQDAMPGAAGPAYFDAGTGPGGPTLNGSGGTQTVADPTKAGVAARLNQLLKSGAPDAQVQQYAASAGADPASLNAVLQFRRQNPGYTGNYNASDLELKDEQIGGFRGAVNAAAQSAPGAYFMNAADGLSAGTLDNFTDNPALARAGLAGVQQAQPSASLLGTITGSGLAAAGAELGAGRLGLQGARAALAGDLAYGAAYGAGSSDEGSRLGGAFVGGVAGGLGGVAGRAASRGIGRALTGSRNPDVAALRAAGVPLTAGQAAGGILKSTEDRLAGLPVVGDIVNARRREGFEGFNRAAFDEGLAPINANTGGVIGEAGVDAARAARSQAYSDALDGVNVQADAPFVGDMQAAINAGRALPDPMSTNLDYTLPTRVGNSFDPNGGLTGRDFQQSIRGLRRDAKAVESLPYGYDFGQVTRQAEGALENLLDRQAPGALPAYQAANTANRNVEILRDAVNRARNGTRSGETGTFAPSQLADAAAANSRRFGGTQGTTAQPFFDLTRAGQRVLPSAVPDSGTAGRAVVAGGLGLAGLGGGAGYAAGDAQTGAGAGLGIAALLAAGGTRTGQRALTAALLDRPDVLIRLGEGVQRQSRIGGLFGAPMLAGAGVSLSNQ